MSIDISKTIAPKSDQLNADDLIGGPRTIKVTSVRLVAEDQPVAIHFDGDEGKPYKPCKSMRRVLVKAWGSDAAKYPGRSMTIYLDEQVRFGGAAVGGVRISHLSHVTSPVTMALTATRGTKKAYTVKPLESVPEKPYLKNVLDAIASAATVDELQAASKRAAALSGEEKETARASYARRLSELKRSTSQDDAAPPESSDTPPTMTYAEVADNICKAKNESQLDDAALDIQFVGTVGMQQELESLYRQRREQMAGQEYAP